MFPTRSEPCRAGLSSQFLLNVILAVLARAINKEIKCIYIIKKEVKLSLLAADIILYTENAKELKEKLLEIINESSKVADYKIKGT